MLDMQGFGGGAASNLMGGGLSAPQITSTGGTKIEQSGYTYHVYFEPGNFTVDAPINVDFLIVAGGGGAGSGPQGGGGGGGGVRCSDPTAPAPLKCDALAVTPGTTYNCTVGTGGAGGGYPHPTFSPTSNAKGTNGNPSSINPAPTNFNSSGGGGGGYPPDRTGKNGGCGGGAGGGAFLSSGGSGDSPGRNPDQGFDAGDARSDGTPWAIGGSGGGGAGDEGYGPRQKGKGPTPSNPIPFNSGFNCDGGQGFSVPGLPGSIFSPAVPAPDNTAHKTMPNGVVAPGAGWSPHTYYAGGGASASPPTSGSGGLGGGGSYGSPGNPTIGGNRGKFGSGGGGGSNEYGGSNGGPGMVVVYYPWEEGG